MLMTLALAALALQATDSGRVADTTIERRDTVSARTAPTDTVRRRPRAIEYSDWYARRLEIHRIASYTMLPLFGTEYVLGQRLITGAALPHSPTANAHVLVASGIAALFTVNTGTGLWNLWDSRADPAG